MLNNINIAISTVWREEDYLHLSLNSLLADLPKDVQHPICLVVGSPVTTHLDRWRLIPGISVIEMGPSTWAWIKDGQTYYRATWNYYRCLTQPLAGTRGTLVLEDDIRFARGWYARLDAALAALEEQCGPKFLLALYAASYSLQKERKSGQLYAEYWHELFWNTQGIYYSASVRREFAKYLKAHGVVANENHYDIILRDYLVQADIPLFSTSPCLIQHTGKTSVIQNKWHESTDFMEDVTTEPLGEVV